MAPRELPCWKITNCGRTDCYLALPDSTKPCWELASELDDYRTAMNICRDCVVYVAKQEDSKLSDEEVSAIVAQKESCLLLNRCPGGRVAQG